MPSIAPIRSNTFGTAGSRSRGSRAWTQSAGRRSLRSKVVTVLQDDLTLEFTAPLWRWEARREFWTFVSLPAELTGEVRELAGDLPRGFGAIRAHARVGAKQWWTSVFRRTPTASTCCR